MTGTIKTGAILIEEGALMPESLRFESEPYSNGWRAVNNLDGYGLGRKIREAGWTFFYMAGEIRASVFGFDGEKALRRAVNRLLANLKAEKFNCLQITQVAAKRFLGLPYVTVSAHQRHIQESMFLHASMPRQTPCRMGPNQTSCRLKVGNGFTREELCRKETVTKPGLAENAAAKFSGESALESCERRWSPGGRLIRSSCQGYM